MPAVRRGPERSPLCAAALRPPRPPRPDPGPRRALPAPPQGFARDLPAPPTPPACQQHGPELWAGRAAALGEGKPSRRGGLRDRPRWTRSWSPSRPTGCFQIQLPGLGGS